ncbi:DUF4405 domain-containing protein [Clostridium sp.]|uniref:DUF4405 domain-containing protein n=1 Tax=Clostridium sp. TaxID=1506 RepID=UPI003F3743A3
MNKKNIMKYVLDVVLAIGFMLMYDKRAIGINLHELLGLGIGVGVITHLILNYKWIIGISKKLFSTKLNNRTRVVYIINLLLVVCMILIMVGGIFISKTIFTNIHSQNQGLWKGIHIAVSNVALALIGMHIGLNFNWIKGMTKRIFKVKESKKYSQIIARVLVCVVFIFGVYNTSSQRFIQKTVMGFKMNQMQPIGEHPVKGDGNGKERPEGLKKPDLNRENMSEEQIKEFEANMKNRGDMENRHNIKGDFAKGKTSPVVLIINYTSILSVFIITTYYIDKLIKNRNKNNGGI